MWIKFCPCRNLSGMYLQCTSWMLISVWHSIVLAGLYYLNDTWTMVIQSLHSLCIVPYAMEHEMAHTKHNVVYAQCLFFATATGQARCKQFQHDCTTKSHRPLHFNELHLVCHATRVAANNLHLSVDRWQRTPSKEKYNVQDSGTIQETSEE